MVIYRDQWVFLDYLPLGLTDALNGWWQVITSRYFYKFVYIKVFTPSRKLSPRKYVFHRGKNLYSKERTFFRGKKSLLRGENTFLRKYVFHLGEKSLLRGENFSPRKHVFHHREKSCDHEPRHQCIFVYGICSLQQHPEEGRTAAALPILASILIIM